MSERSEPGWEEAVTPERQRRRGPQEFSGGSSFEGVPEHLIPSKQADADDSAVRAEPARPQRACQRPSRRGERALRRRTR